jgi:hypothetical protein
LILFRNDGNLDRPMLLLSLSLPFHDHDDDDNNDVGVGVGVDKFELLKCNPLHACNIGGRKSVNLYNMFGSYFTRDFVSDQPQYFFCNILKVCSDIVFVNLTSNDSAKFGIDADLPASYANPSYSTR